MRRHMRAKRTTFGKNAEDQSATSLVDAQFYYGNRKNCEKNEKKSFGYFLSFTDFISEDILKKIFRLIKFLISN